MNEIIGMDRAYAKNARINDLDDITIKNTISEHIKKGHRHLHNILIEIISREKYEDITNEALSKVDKTTYIKLTQMALLNIYNKLPENERNKLGSIEEITEMTESIAKMAYEEKIPSKSRRKILSSRQNIMIEELLDKEYIAYLGGKRHFGEFTRQYISKRIPIIYCDHVAMELSGFAHLKNDLMPSEDNEINMFQSDFDKGEAINNIYSKNKPEVALVDAMNASYIKSKNPESMFTLFCFGQDLKQKYIDSEKTEPIFSKVDKILSVGFSFDNSRSIMQKYKNITSIEKMCLRK
jgi:hypothetical protein